MPGSEGAGEGEKLVEAGYGPDDLGELLGEAGLLLGRYLQLIDVAELVELAQGVPTDDLLEQLDARYSALIPRDQVISDQFEARLQQRPDDFALAS